ncbi:HAD family hydrolase [Aureimonas leprariae]|uniref:phosphoglycolate phosphatase n=2 Tax=Plantimonas leprariae TaxID=2615207 RepID=A0A7V7U0P5_9HYPH|nr:HAD family hydrolase [Aureimonas leprariae]
MRRDVHPALVGVRAVLFDKDGTLLDFEATWGPATAEVLDELAGGDIAMIAALATSCGFVPGENRFLPDSPIIGGDADEFAPAWAERLGDPYDRALLTRLDEAFRAASLRHLTAYDDVPVALARLTEAGLPVGIATNDFEQTARAHLEKLAIDGFFGFVAGYDSGFGGKPGPGMVQAFAGATGLPASAVALLGDSPHDMHAARAAGAVPVGIARTSAASQALNDLPVLTVTDLGELLAALGLG